MSETNRRGRSGAPPAGSPGRYLLSLTPVEIAACAEAGSFLQSAFWGSFKARFGWKALAFRAEWGAAGAGSETAPGSGAPGGAAPGSGAALPLLVLHRPLGPALSFAYIPWGPELPPAFPAAHGVRGEAAAELAASLRPFLPRGTAFIRFDLPWYTEEGAPAETAAAGNSGLGDGVSLSPNPPPPFRRAAADVQPPHTALVDLLPEEAAILGAMKSKWRYNVSLAEKKGIAVTAFVSAAAPEPGLPSEVREVPGLRAALEPFYALYRETAARDGIAIHGLEYYRVLFEEARAHGADLRLYLASHEGENLAGIVTLFRGREAVYLYGASSSRKRNLMAPYALQWRAMRDARAAGCAYYDLFGIPPRPPEEDPNHPMTGLYRFKTGFTGDEAAGKRPGGTIIHRPGSWDYPLRPAAWALYALAEKTRKKIRDLKKRR